MNSLGRTAHQVLQFQDGDYLSFRSDEMENQMHPFGRRNPHREETDEVTNGDGLVPG